MKRKICVITGTRADYGIYYPILKKIKASGKLGLYIVATSMHLMKEFGYTAKQIEKDGFKIYEKVDVSYSKDTGAAMAFSAGRAVSAFSRTFSRLKPDIVLVLGDRAEMLSAAIAANYMNIPVAHIHGGELSGHVDGVVRHAITKLSHIHFPATKKAKEVIRKLGEETSRVFVCGAPALDRILAGHATGEKILEKKYKIKKNKPFVLVVQHPVNSESEDAAGQIKTTLDAVAAFGSSAIVIYPNADAGGRKMIKVIEQYVMRYDRFRAYKSIPHEDYLGLMKAASVLVGNSSSGIIEAPSFKLPAVNIGRRQDRREQSSNVINVPSDVKKIKEALKAAVLDRSFRAKVKKNRNPYGDGHASDRIVKVLGTLRLDRDLLDKKTVFWSRR